MLNEFKLIGPKSSLTQINIKHKANSAQNLKQIHEEGPIGKSSWSLLLILSLSFVLRDLNIERREKGKKRISSQISLQVQSRLQAQAYIHQTSLKSSSQESIKQPPNSTKSSNPVKFKQSSLKQLSRIRCETEIVTTPFKINK